MNEQQKQYVDALANSYYCTPSKDTLTRLINILTPTIELIAIKYTNNNEDKEDLEQILKLDVCELITKRWTMNKDKPFHHLLFRQLKNKAINYYHKDKSGITTSDIDTSEYIGTESFENNYYDKETIKDILNAIDLYSSEKNKERDTALINLIYIGHKTSKAGKMVGLYASNLRNTLIRIRKMYERYSNSSKLNTF